MKNFSWGTGIAISLVLFMLLIAGFAVRMMLAGEKLAEDRPYERALEYQKQMEIIARSRPFETRIAVNLLSGSKTVEIKFADTLGYRSLKVYFYRPSDAGQDKTFDFTGKPFVNPLMIPVGEMDKGFWRVKLEWTDPASTAFRVEKTINLL